MATPTSQSREPTLEQRIHMTSSFHSFLHYASLTMLVAAPALIALPPRKLDLYTLSLTGLFVGSCNHLTKERTGAGLLYQLPGATMPAYALDFQERQRAMNEGRRLLELGDDTKVKEPQKAVEKQIERPADDWKTRRLEEEQKKLDEGEGYGGMIVDQIWEVWNWGEKKAEELKETDERVVAQQKKGKGKTTSVLGGQQLSLDQRQRRWAEEFPEIGKG